ncbi:hypothetical protein N7491_003100 [Penicillium cf. griseofulvum]|uniref:Uncharacterized protein n=1 Tax=Penicillium cf. griseofulvum TaxID=2972120 RepID=A0A9W9MRW7_9EURO|nr:hypothetical protein N7472_002728 [Penicillium cf. griseofulvum]KAJ5440694.1 hypothetical protein N7491_003100 [Penicillium cf. griseofulvum]
MNENINLSAANGTWYGELLDSPLCHKCLELHDHHACTAPSKPFLDSPDALSLPPRSIKSRITGALSIHDYHKFLSKSADRMGDPVDHTGRKLKRKTAALHLNRPSALPISYPVSVSSVASSPPPLSPSYSHSIVSQWSEEPEIGEAQTVHYQAAQSPRLPVASDLGTRARPNRKRLVQNTFREKLQQRAQAQAEEAERASKPQPSDSMLASTQAVATVSHGGACFEILNPRKSLDLARIVSYIEDVDNCSVVSSDNQRDSTFSIDQGLDRASLSQFTDASLPSFYSTNSLYTSLQADSLTPKGQPTNIASSSQRTHERIQSLSDYSINEQSFNYWSRPVQHTEDNGLRIQTYNDHPRSNGEIAQSPYITSTTEKSNLPNVEFSNRPSTPSTQTFYSESEIGEPGSPVYANGNWAQVDDRDRGILFDSREDQTTPDHHFSYSQEHELPTPRESPLDTPGDSPIPIYTPFDSAYPYPTSVSTSKLPHYSAPFDPYTYDPVYLDPHVQSVLAAANAETMGLRGSPARALDELQRGVHTGETSPRFEFQRRKSDERKSGAQRKGLRKFFSWKHGN